MNHRDPPPDGAIGSATRHTGRLAGGLKIAGAIFAGVVKGLAPRERPPAAVAVTRPSSLKGGTEPTHSGTIGSNKTAAWASPQAVWAILKDAGSQWMEDKAPRLGAALAYYTVFSLAPLLVIVIAMAGLIFGQEAAAGQLTGQIQSVVGENGATAIQALLASANKPTSGILATAIGIAMLLLGAAGLFCQLQDALNTVWEVQPKPGRGLLGFLRDRFLSLSMVLGTAFLLLVSLVVSAALAALGSLFGAWGASFLGHALDLALAPVVIMLLFAMIYRFLPDATIAWKDVWFGSAVTAFLFTLGKFLIGLYLSQTGTASSFGAAGSLAVLLIWLYYSSQIFLFGAELTKAYANRFGSRIVPKPNAVSVTKNVHAPQGVP